VALTLHPTAADDGLQQVEDVVAAATADPQAVRPLHRQ
jgi:hypothetical protein